MNIGPAQILIIILVIVLLFGARKLPELARSVGRSMRIFKSEVKEMKEEDAGSTAASATQLTDEDFWNSPENQPRQIPPQQPNPQQSPAQHYQQPNQQNQ